MRLSQGYRGLLMYSEELPLLAKVKKCNTDLNIVVYSCNIPILLINK